MTSYTTTSSNANPNNNTNKSSRGGGGNRSASNYYPNPNQPSSSTTPMDTTTCSSHQQLSDNAMMMTVSSSIMVWNNNAVVLMEQGKFQQACEVLQTAHDRLEILLELQTAMTAKSHLPQEETSHAHLPLHTVALHHHDMPSAARAHATATSTVAVFTLCNRAFVFPDLSTAKGDTVSFACPHVQSQIQGTLLFNLALGFHNMAIWRGSSRLLSAALRLYERSYSVVRDAWEGSSLEDILLLLMAQFNNMGHIHSNTFDMERTRHCMAWLQSAIAWKGSASMEGEAYFFFFKNISYIPMQEVTLAPAA